MKSKLYDKIANIYFYVVAVFLILLLVSLISYILYQGRTKLNIDFLTSPPKFMEAGGGIGPQLFNSLQLLIITLIISVPIGLGAGIYMAEYAKPGLLTEIIRLSAETLSSMPSIVVGLFGLLVFVTMTGWGYSLVAGALTLTVLNLPVMTRVSEDSIRSVPNSLREASYALGATKWQTIVKVVVPAAMPGIITGIILTAGRIFGEAAALLYTAGMSSPALNFSNLNPSSPTSPLNIFRPAETLAVYIWKVNSEGLAPDARQIADGAAAVLLLMVLIFNILARWLGNTLYKRMTGEK
ncbi:phosphate ABC transporter permease PstA [Thermoanaerobacter brockii subsp. lactiethylicus]|jgi:phosphate transport system permease protein|uniref:Phosphate transport system permease protein PstA n=2 Tax=Thermoanaerobacter TaxID=1754 RepID=B0K8M3_THEP3|nr:MULTISPECIES: phosphate ABC transporter permease PstA [Thermoanaerobacter]ABY93265.1 phosphate ABC transporter, inner membrane subunit PstA [Thermoanaerobacter sp. X514]ABY94486.1 phosphate ABC transporter, inner membrane subunit PstA [Thermoanaerobacter pseudethanolicus ATCC 33223]ADV79439.1 phosphate ABC transporter, inner membrane subunit PstA [Thermoanaerobacter brockii subsp. finnii Ako-1]HBW59404.1 phosphate ABC transporter permease PtsA [Thermoanaerobacter sp.]